MSQKAAAATGHHARFRPLPVAVTFDDEWEYGAKDAFERRALTDVDERARSAAGHLRPLRQLLSRVPGERQEHARSQLPRARGNARRGGSPAARGPRDHAERRRVSRRLRPDRQTTVCVQDRRRASRVIVSAGSLGSTELLLRCRDEFRTLPRLSRALGHRLERERRLHDDLDSGASRSTRRTARRSPPRRLPRRRRRRQALLRAGWRLSRITSGR